MTRSTYVLVIGLALVGAGAAEHATERNAARMAESARAFLTSLDSGQRERTAFAWESEERLRFHFIPPETFRREGLRIQEMTAPQRQRAHALLQSGLSERGYMTATQIMEAEGILRTLEGEGRRFARDPEAYVVAVFGEPTTDGTWAWRFEGHHLSLQFTVVGGDVTVSSPTFLAASPAEIPSGPKRGMRPLGRQEDAGRALLGSLTVEQRAVAVIDTIAPRDIVSAMRPEVGPLATAGIRAGDLTGVQRSLLMDVIEAWTSVMNEEIAALRWAKIRAGSTDDIRFAWAGGTLRGEVSYFRVQGPTFVIEFDNTANDPNHVHTGWRDFEGDFGRDLLREHVEARAH